MIRIINIVLVALMLGAATWTYHVKHEAERQLTEIRDLESRIALEHDTIDLLEADWSYLSQPARLQTLSERYGQDLGLRPTKPQQIVNPSELPAMPEKQNGDAVADIIAGEIDTGLTTGSVGGN